MAIYKMTAKKGKKVIYNEETNLPSNPKEFANAIVKIDKAAGAKVYTRKEKAQKNQRVAEYVAIYRKEGITVEYELKYPKHGKKTKKPKK